MLRTPRPCLLFSGGVDSALVAQLLLEAGTPPTTLFVDYGQPAAKAEALASSALAKHFGLNRHCVSIQGLQIPANGEIIGRNDLLLAVARVAAPDRDVAIGTHAGTGYLDCSPEHKDAWQRLMDVQHSGTIRVLAPLLHLSKGEVFALAKDRAVPLEITHSCEADNDPCEQCASCLDRAWLGESA